MKVEITHNTRYGMGEGTEGHVAMDHRIRRRIY